MNPYGLVAAASMTSLTSSPKTPLTSANSLARAMFTARNVFSRILVSSAAFMELTGITFSMID